MDHRDPEAHAALPPFCQPSLRCELVLLYRATAPFSSRPFGRSRVDKAGETKRPLSYKSQGRSNTPSPDAASPGACQGPRACGSALQRDSSPHPTAARSLLSPPLCSSRASLACTDISPTERQSLWQLSCLLAWSERRGPTWVGACACSEAGIHPSPDVLPLGCLTTAPHGHGTSGAAGGVAPGLGLG